MNLMILPDPNDGPIYDFAAPIGMHWSGVDSGLMLELLRTKALTRLRNVSFLGGIDYLIVRNPNGSRGNRRYTRYQHSLGVARLANFYCSLKGIDDAGRNMACVAALLHDIGHAPLSHSLEPVFKTRFGMDHHLASRLIITGASPFGTEVLDVLRRHDIDPEYVLATIEGKTDEFDKFFSGPINFDTIEGILRSRSYNVHDRKMSSPELIVEAAALRRSRKDRAVVDKFWGFKDQTYRTVINSRQGVLADTICQFFLSNDIGKFSQESYYLTEEQFFRKLPKLRSILTSKTFEIAVAEKLQDPIEYKSRRFYIDEKASFQDRDDSRRYGQTKIPRTLVVGTPAEVGVYNGTWDLFSDDGD